MSYTPGPWVAEAGYDGSWHVYVPAKESDAPYNEADAHLIAAAPEMAELLQRFADAFDATDLELATTAARTLLARIQGEPE